MTTLRKTLVIVAVMMAQVSGGETNALFSQSLYVAESLYTADSVSFGDGKVVVNTKDGSVTTKLPLDEASRTIWEGIKQFAQLLPMLQSETNRWGPSRFPHHEVIVTVTTNGPYHPKQYKSITTYATYPATTEEVWSDSPEGWSGWFGYSVSQPTRDNPDVRITEVIKTTTLRFEYEGKEYAVEAGREVLSSERKTRKVTEVWE